MRHAALGTKTLLLASLFAVTAVLKLLWPQLGPDTSWSAYAVRSQYVAAVEVIVVALLLLPPARRAGLIGAVLMLIGGSVHLVISSVHEIGACSCLGTLVKTTPVVHAALLTLGAGLAIGCTTELDPLVDS